MITEKDILGSKKDYDKKKAMIIKEKGYDFFRENQKKTFKKMFGKK